MEAHVSQLTGLAIVVVAALLCGLGMERLRQPAVVGYILAGLLLGPSGLALVKGRAEIEFIAELGVLMLLFIIGMELSLRSFRRLWGVALLATLGQVAASLGVMALFAWSVGWPLEVAVLLGFVVALSSTAVTIKVLEDLGELRSRVGRVTVGVLIAQDLAVVPMMLSVNALAGNGIEPVRLAAIPSAVAILVALVWWLSRGRRPNLPWAERFAGHADLGPLMGLVLCFGAAALSGLAGLSPAYGAFLAGIVIGNSRQRQAMLGHVQPVQSILMMVFFLSIGLLIDLGFVWRNLGSVLVLLLFVAVFKTALNVALLRLLGQTWQHAFMAGALLAQIGEFSFVLTLAALGAGLIDTPLSRLVVAVTVLSLALSPLWVATARRLQGLAAHHGASGLDILRLVYGPTAARLIYGPEAAHLQDGLREAGETARRLATRLRRRNGNATPKEPPRDA